MIDFLHLHSTSICSQKFFEYLENFNKFIKSFKNYENREISIMLDSATSNNIQLALSIVKQTLEILHPPLTCYS